jgi:hydrogenase-4 component B
VPSLLHAPLAVYLAVLATWVVIGCAGLLRPHSVAFAGRTLFLLGAAAAALLAMTAAASLGRPPETLVLPCGLPDLPMHLRRDALTDLFVLLLGSAACGISLFGAGYFRSGQGTAPGLLCLQYHVFLAAVGLVLLADDAYAFMVAWETMALASYFLVTTQHRLAEIRRAGFLYLVMAHLSAIAILLAFGVLQGGSWRFTFDAMRAAELTPGAATLAFLLALTGFGVKGGLVPGHVWLPEAHPAAPSPVSALMSGVMLKTALYGLMRVSFDLIDVRAWWWGLLVLALGLASAFYGVIFAAVQTEMKRLLAWSSIENLGLAFSGLGLALVFEAARMPAVAALALVATLYHALNHALVKSALFLATGSVLHATGERNLGRLGGLVHRMPWVAWPTLLAVFAIAGLPPLNGFVAEWLLLQAFLFAPDVPMNFIDMLLPMGAAIVVLAAALAAYVMVKFYGIVFLGQPREGSLANARDAGWLERLGLLLLVGGAVGLGLFPVQVVAELDLVARLLLGAGIGPSADGWWLLAPGVTRHATYAPLGYVALAALAVGCTVLAVHGLSRRGVRRAPPWDCGSGALDPRMQDTAEGFGQPIRHVFQAFFHTTRSLPDPAEREPRYRIEIVDRVWLLAYQPLARAIGRLADLVAQVQQGRISTYLTYSFATLLLLLAWVL